MPQKENLNEFDKLMLQIDEICEMAEDLAARAKQLADEAEEHLRWGRIVTGKQVVIVTGKQIGRAHV